MHTSSLHFLAFFFAAGFFAGAFFAAAFFFAFIVQFLILVLRFRLHPVWSPESGLGPSSM
jgi:hypothetical protein